MQVVWDAKTQEGGKKPVKHKDTGILDRFRGRASHLQNVTPEQRKAVLEKARLARAANVAARRASTLRTDFLESSHWDDLARARGLRLPPWGQPCTVSRMRTFIHKAGLSETACKEWLGYSLAKFAGCNPSWPCRAFAGLVLEELAERGDRDEQHN